ncbi:proline-rich transmembrane protein 3 [Oryzias latipes]|uniref:Proline-rich transmembrane protein 3/4 domain-containing protein n=1 Tax=Oryzias latipes TaxID=8090 RepID=A0A3B3I341_ORYLA|nr:proline-rich transmembrane protein 3 [Oryzias latipes]XP_023812454.1 proline-rich transmembrane protein 3 [Oryzias latipes]
MAFTTLHFLGFLLLFLHVLDAQTVIGYSSSFSSMDLPRSSSPTKQTFRFWPSLPPRGRSDVPIRVTMQDRLTTMNAVEQGQRITSETTHFSPSFTMTSSAENPISETVVTEPTSSRPRTDTARLAFKQALRRGEAATKHPYQPLNVRSSTTVGDDGLGTAGNSDKGSVGDSEDGDTQGLGSGTVALKKDDLLPPLPTRGNEMAQYQLQAQTMMSKVSDVKPLTSESHMAVLTTAITSSTASTGQHPGKRIPQPLNTTQQIPQTVGLPGKVASNNPSAEGVGPNQGAAALTSLQPTSPSANQQPQTAGQLLLAKNSSILKTLSADVRPTQKPVGTSTQNGKTVQLGRHAAGTTVQSSRTGNSSRLTPSDVPVTRSRFSPTYQASVVQRNHSVQLRHPYQAPHSPYNPAPSPSAHPYPNGTFLYWGDMSRTLAFAWELHVYGSASLFLLLFAGAALGLTLSPGTNCPHRGALALANALLFLAGGLRAALFFIDPYGTRNVLPHSAVAALYNLPLHLLVWTQASLVLLALRATGISVFPVTMEHPPLIGVLAVLHCTLMLGVDLLSAALSPVVPVTLQVLSLCWGLAICLGFLCFVFPRIRCPTDLSHGAEVRRKTWTGNQKIGVILGKVLAVCAVLGALCCGLHVHATLWLYGFLGNWTSFNWGWWLVHFWARLLELGWGFALLLLSSWVFWRPAGTRRGEEGGQEGRPAGDLATPGQSVGSPQRHTCWSKIVQSLRGKPCRKSDSNGVGGGTGDIPNNWAGQECAGTDISKNLIKNQNHEQSTIQPDCGKDSNRGHNHRDHAAEQGESGGSVGSGMVLQPLGRPLQRSVSGGLDHDRDTSMSFCEFDLRPPSPIDLTRSIDEALHREHLLEGGSLFHPLNPQSRSPSPRSAFSQGPWLRRNSDPQLLSDSSDAPTESSMPLGGSILSSVPSRQVTAPPTPSHPDNRWVDNRVLSVPSSVSCPVSLRPTRTSTGHLCEDDTRPFITPDSERARGKSGRSVGSRSYLEVSRHDDSISASSEIIDL